MKARLYTKVCAPSRGKSSNTRCVSINERGHSVLSQQQSNISAEVLYNSLSNSTPNPAGIASRVTYCNNCDNMDHASFHTNSRCPGVTHKV
jgi:hypothetical protein